MNSFSKIVDILLVTILLFIVPVYYSALKQDNINQTVVTTQTSIFVDSIRDKGYIDRQMMDIFLHELSSTSAIYSVEFEHYKKIYTSSDSSLYELEYELCNDDMVKNGIYSEETGGYYMKTGDFIKVHVMSKGQTIGERIQGVITGTSMSGSINVVYGGVIRDEAY